MLKENLDELKKVEQNVLNVYQKQNPSTFKIEDDKEAYDRLEIFTERLFTHSLKLLPKVFKDARLLEFGSGTGEKSLAFLKWGAHCNFVELNPDANKRAELLFKLLSPNGQYKISECSLFDFKTTESYDITISNGVIHHTNDKEKAFAKLISFLRPGGINILGIGNTAGGFQRNLQRTIVYTFAGNDEEEIELIANDLFKEHLDRAEKFGGRSRKAIIYDTYVNPKVDSLSIIELLNWYKKYNLHHFSSWPQMDSSLFADDLAGNVDHRDYPYFFSRSEWAWSIHRNPDFELAKKMNLEMKPFTSSFMSFTNSLNNAQSATLEFDKIEENLYNLYKSSWKNLNHHTYFDNLHKMLQEVELIVKALKKKDYKTTSKIIKKSRSLFRGTSGIGMTYFVAIKS